MPSGTSLADSGVLPLTADDPRDVGGFRLLGRLGSGGMGVVYLGKRATSLTETCAVKVVRPDLAGDPDFRARFAREVDCSTAARGEGVARIVDSCTDCDIPWLASEYLPGPTLKQRVNQGGPLVGEELRTFASGVAIAVASLHSVGVVHRDLKPSNVVLAPTGPHLIDFGVARATDDAALTRTGFAVGSPGWMAPERVHGQAEGATIDVYGWGVLVAFAALGRHPWGDGSPTALQSRMLHVAPTLSAVPDSLRPLVERALSTDPSRRPSITEVVLATSASGHVPLTPTALLPVTQLMTTAGAPATAPISDADDAHERRSRRPLLVLVATLALLGGLVVAAASVGMGGDGREPGPATPSPSVITSDVPTPAPSTPAPSSPAPTTPAPSDEATSDDDGDSSGPGQGQGNGEGNGQGNDKDKKNDDEGDEGDD